MNAEFFLRYSRLDLSNYKFAKKRKKLNLFTIYSELKILKGRC